MLQHAADTPRDDAPPAPAWWSATLAGLGGLALLGTLLYGSRSFSEWREERDIQALYANQNATTDDWVAASDARPDGAQLAQAAAGKLEGSTRRASRSEALELREEAARLYERAVEEDPFDGLAKLRLARALLRAAPDEFQGNQVAARARELIEAAFATSPSVPAVAEEALELLVVWIRDEQGGAELSRRMLAANPKFVKKLADVAYEGGVEPSRLYAEYLPNLSGLMDDAGKPTTVASLLASEYVLRLWLPELADLAKAAMDAKNPEDLRPVAPQVVELLHEDAETEPLGEALWKKLYGELSPSWPDENAVFLGDPERDAPEGGYGWKIETRDAFFHQWNPAPYVPEFAIPTETEAISLGRHPNLQRGLAKLSQRLPRLSAGRYRLSFLQSASNRAMSKALTVGLKGRDRRGNEFASESQPRLSSEWAPVEVEFNLPNGLHRAELYFLLDPRNLPASVRPESCSLCRFRLERIGGPTASTE